MKVPLLGEESVDYRKGSMNRNNGAKARKLYIILAAVCVVAAVIYIYNLSSSLAQANLKNDNLNENIQEQRMVLERQGKELAEKESAINAKERDIESKNVENSGLAGQIENLKSEIDDLKRDKENAELENNALENENENMNEELSQLNYTLQKHSDDAKNREQQLNDIKDEKLKLEGEVNKLQKEVETLNLELMETQKNTKQDTQTGKQDSPISEKPVKTFSETPEKPEATVTEKPEQEAAKNVEKPPESETQTSSHNQTNTQVEKPGAQLGDNTTQSDDKQTQVENIPNQQTTEGEGNHQPDNQPDTQVDQQPDTQADTQPDTQPDRQPDTQPGNQLENQPDQQPDTQVDAQPPDSVEEHGMEADQGREKPDLIEIGNQANVNDDQHDPDLFDKQENADVNGAYDDDDNDNDDVDAGDQNLGQLPDHQPNDQFQVDDNFEDQDVDDDHNNDGN